MTYTFSCPAPCQKIIVVEACNDDDAVEKLIKAGAMICRNRQSSGSCNTIHLVMHTLPEKQLREAVRSYMREENNPVVDSGKLLS